MEGERGGEGREGGREGGEGREGGREGGSEGEGEGLVVFVRGRATSARSMETHTHVVKFLKF